MVNQNIVHPFLVSLNERAPGNFVLVLKTDCEIDELRLFIAEKNLGLDENVEKSICTIFNP